MQHFSFPKGAVRSSMGALSASLVALTLAACGGGSAGSPPGANSNNATTQTGTVTPAPTTPAATQTTTVTPVATPTVVTTPTPTPTTATGMAQASGTVVSSSPADVANFSPTDSSTRGANALFTVINAREELHYFTSGDRSIDASGTTNGAPDVSYIFSSTRGQINSLIYIESRF